MVFESLTRSNRMNRSLSRKKIVSCLFVLLSLFFLLFAQSVFSRTKTYTVTNTSGSSSSHGSLPWALKQANLSSISAIIKFDIKPGGKIHRIELEDRLWINETVDIKGTSQPGYSNRVLIQIDANGLPNVFTVLNDDAVGVGGSNSQISGLQLFGFTKNAIATQPGADNITISDNYIGFYWDFEKNKWWRNFEANLSDWEIENISNPVYGDYIQAIGIGIQSSYNIVKNNVISGVHNGISIGYDFESQGSESWGPICQGNRIINNKIGTTPDGQYILSNTKMPQEYRPDPSANPFGSPFVWRYFGNNSDGIYLAALAQETTIASNIVSGNFSVGIELLHETVTKNKVFGNKVGLDSTGGTALPNGELGIIVSNGAHHNIIGGDEGGNVVSGNFYAGIELGGENSFQRASYNKIMGNLVGCDMNGNYAIGYQNAGIHLGTIHSTQNTIVGNTVVGNNWGIYLEDAYQNCIVGNSIGKTFSGKNIGNQKSGLVLDQADENYIVDNTIQYNGYATTGHDDWFFGIWNMGSNGNLFYNNWVKDNKTNSNVQEQTLPGCLFIDSVLGLYVPCAEFQGMKLRLYFSYSQDVQNADNLLWKLNESLIQIIDSSTSYGHCCLSLSNDLSFQSDNAIYQGQTLNLVLNFDSIRSSSEGLYWGLSLK